MTLIKLIDAEHLFYCLSLFHS